MKMSHRAKRMHRFQKRSKASGLNLVSLMDIFTILVFFLLVSSSSVQQLPNSKDIRLPTSVAKKTPKETIIIMVTPESIVVEGNKVASISDVLASKEDVIEGLKKELKFHEERINSVLAYSSPTTDKKAGKEVTIMGHENLPYNLMRKVLATCRQANFTKIAFAATQKAKG